MLDKIRVVLVNTSHPGNIGGAARAMMNMGLSRLVLVQPQKFPSGEAVARASGAVGILNNARVVDTLEQALEGSHVVFGTSARIRYISLPTVDPRGCAEQSLKQIQQDSDCEIAIVFGREHAGLTNEELQQCHYRVQVPTNPNFSSLNLATAVQVVAYELRMQWLGLTEQASGLEHQAPEDLPESEKLASHDELERLFEHLEQALIDIEFLDPAKPKLLMSRLRRLYGKAHLQKSEVNILRGILTETQKAARGELISRGKTPHA